MLPLYRNQSIDLQCKLVNCMYVCICIIGIVTLNETVILNFHLLIKTLPKNFNFYEFSICLFCLPQIILFTYFA